MAEPTTRARRNFIYGQMAVITTRAKLTTGMSNDVGNPSKSLQAASCVYESRTKFDEVKRSLSPQTQVRVRAQSAVEAKCGNCEEHALVAFVELKRMGVGDVEIVRLTNRDHVFVVAGRDHNSQINDPKAWGPDAMVIDAWTGKTHAAAELSSHWPGGIPRIYYRE